ncbi:MAG: hypothetical protein D3906_12215, partial [Candidatus Electrothrix sp. AUS1_2]|nr:hypothetical protein [Candidatus Electrothrix sp. AUS1_2]
MADKKHRGKKKNDSRKQHNPKHRSEKKQDHSAAAGGKSGETTVRATLSLTAKGFGFAVLEGNV